MPWGNRRRTFVQVERNLHLTLNWRHGERSAAKSLLDQCAANPSLLVDVVDYALRNILLGSYHQNSATIADDLERALLESGAAWRVGRIEGTPTTAWNAAPILPLRPRLHASPTKRPGRVRTSQRPGTRRTAATPIRRRRTAKPSRRSRRAPSPSCCPTTRRRLSAR